MKRKPKNYIDNKTFLSYLVDYREVCAQADAAEQPKPQVTEKIGLCLFQIANRLATKPNFSGYMFKDEMISDGIENAVDAVLKFNPEKSQNPFAYFTQIIWYAFLRRIQKEKKQMYIRFKSSQAMIAAGETYTGEDLNLNLNTTADYMNDFIQDFEDKLQRDKEKKK